MSPSAHDVTEALTCLTDSTSLILASAFDKGLDGCDLPGLYSWWADGHAQQVITDVLGEQVDSLIYVGQTGATKWPSGKRSDGTLGSRVADQHIGGNARSSTFRLTISAILFSPLGLDVEKAGRLCRDDRHRVTEWICSHLSVALCPFPERDLLGDLESKALDSIDAPLNLRGMAATPGRDRLTQLRRLITQPDATDQRRSEAVEG